MSVDRAALDSAAASLGLILEEDAKLRLLEYLALLRKWNRVYNLTAVRDPAEMVTHHLFDSLAVVPPLKRELDGAAALREAPARLLDVGSGAGLPGVVIAIACPGVTVTCVDAVAKKSAFVRQVAVELGLVNLRAAHDRVESLHLRSDDRFDVIVARAFAALEKLVDLSNASLAEHGIWLAMKAQSPTEEITALPPTIEVFHVEQITVPQWDAQRCIVWMRRASHSMPIQSNE